MRGVAYFDGGPLHTQVREMELVPEFKQVAYSDELPHAVLGDQPKQRSVPIKYHRYVGQALKRSPTGCTFIYFYQGVS